MASCNEQREHTREKKRNRKKSTTATTNSSSTQKKLYTQNEYYLFDACMTLVRFVLLTDTDDEAYSQCANDPFMQPAHEHIRRIIYDTQKAAN